MGQDHSTTVPDKLERPDELTQEEIDRGFCPRLKKSDFEKFVKMTKFDLSFGMKVVKRLHEIEEAKRKKEASCEHEWKNTHEFVYDYQHQMCIKCNKKRMF